MTVFPIMFTSIISLLVFVSVSSAIDSISSFQSIRDGETLVSSGGSFELGFFSPGNSENRYLGIWYKNIPVQTVVWVANRCSPIKTNSSGLLTINNTGSLVLLNNNRSVVWSTRSFKEAQKPILRLLDTGNLVLMNNNSRSYLWQSFDYPSDTLLAGMKLGWDFRTDLRRSLSAWKSSNDPCPGNIRYGFELQSHTSPEIFMRKGNAKYYRSGPWNGLRFSGVPELAANPLYDFRFVYDDHEFYYQYNLKINVFIRIVLNETTSTRRWYVWHPDNLTWGLFSSTPTNDCDKYGFCGANGGCVINKNAATCHCLRGFKPTSQERWDLSNHSGGCVRNTPLSCKDQDKDGFIKVVGLKLPDTTHSWVNQSLNLMECREKCLRNCSCIAYSNSDIRGQGSGCIIWFGDLLDIRQFSSDGQDLYVRMPASEIDAKTDVMRRVVIISAVVGGASGMLLVGYCIFRRSCLKASITLIPIIFAKLEALVVLGKDLICLLAFKQINVRRNLRSGMAKNS